MIKIEHLEETMDVYDITVESNHNFFANDILVHNCQEIFIPTKPFNSPADLYKKTYNEKTDGEIGLCTIAAIVAPNIESDEQYAEVAYYALKMIDVCIHKSDYAFPALAHTAKSRLSAGVGIIGLAHLMAKENLKYDSLDGRNFIHELAETHMWHLLNASLKLGKELGNAPWMHKTKWPEGYLPLDTYEKKVDTFITIDNKRDWETLRGKIIENKGIRNSVVGAHMPSESSSQSSGTTNGLYAVRELSLMKTNDTVVNHWVAPDSTKLKNKYQLAWDIKNSELIKMYAIVQKWTDQGISADLYADLTKGDKISSKEIIDDYILQVSSGMKSRYYVTSLTSSGNDLSTEENALTDLSSEDEIGECEACTL
jgi:ribonucleoside-diphosphate reductase alpha chain